MTQEADQRPTEMCGWRRADLSSITSIDHTDDRPGPSGTYCLAPSVSTRVFESLACAIDWPAVGAMMQLFAFPSLYA